MAYNYGFRNNENAKVKGLCERPGTLIVQQKDGRDCYIVLTDGVETRYLKINQAFKEGTVWKFQTLDRQLHCLEAAIPTAKVIRLSSIMRINGESHLRGEVYGQLVRTSSVIKSWVEPDGIHFLTRSGSHYLAE